MTEPTLKEEDLAVVKVEEGVPIAAPDTAAAADTKSQASEETSPSMETGSNASKEQEAQAKKAASNRSKVWIGIVIGVLVLTGVIVGAVVGSSKSKDKSPTATQSQSDVVVVEGEGDDEPGIDVGDGHVFDKPFGDIQLPLLSEDVLQPYESKEDFKAALTQAAMNTVNEVILNNLKHGNPHQYGYYTEPPMRPPMIVTEEGEVMAVPTEVEMEEEEQQEQQMEGQEDDAVAMEEAAMEAGVGASIASTASAAGKESSQARIRQASLTNSFEDDAEEADLVKNDNTYVYAAYGDYLVVWDRQGNIIAQERMPDNSIQEDGVDSNQDNMNNNNANINERLEPYYHGSNVYINSVQITDSHVLVTTGGMYNYRYNELEFGHLSTHLRVYLKPTADEPSLTLVATKDIHGNYGDARYLEETNTIHFSTGGDFNSYHHLVEPLDLMHYQWMNREEYYEAATRKAREELIPAFVEGITSYFERGDTEFPTMMKINSWKTENALDEEAEEEEEYMMYMDYRGLAGEPYRGFIQVTSIKVDELPSTPIDTPLPVSTTAMLTPTPYSLLYATQDSIVLNVNQNEWRSPDQPSTNVVRLIHLKVDANDGSTFFHGLGTMTGSLPNKFSLDIQGTDLRVATTQQNWWPLDMVFQTCGDSWYFDTECMNEEVWDACFNVTLNCRNVVRSGCPYTYTCEDEGDEPTSSTQNLVAVFDISQEGIMMERGQVEIGEPHEVITAVRFGETFSYAMTFDQRDPFYILDLTVGQAPAIAGTLKLHGFSTYLQPLNDDASLVVGIGQNVTGTGLEQRNTGLMVTVYDVSDTTNPLALDSKMLAPPETSSTYSDAERDNLAVQYNKGRLVIPVTINHYYPDFGAFDPDVMAEFMELNGQVNRNATFPPRMKETGEEFNGFVVLDVANAATDGIKEIMRINHAPRSTGDSHCYYCGGYNTFTRSFLYEDDDSLMTMANNLVISTDLATGNRQWAFNVTVDGEQHSSMCCY